MIHTHSSHVGLDKVAETPDSIIWAGSLGACKCWAAAHGCETEEMEMHPENAQKLRTIWLRDQDQNLSSIHKWDLTRWAISLNRKTWQES